MTELYPDIWVKPAIRNDWKLCRFKNQLLKEKRLNFSVSFFENPSVFLGVGGVHTEELVEEFAACYAKST